MITSPLLSNVHHRAMITPVSLLFTRLIHISPSCFNNLSFVWKSSWNGNCFLDWTSNPMFYTNPLIQKTLNPIWMMF